MKKPYMRTIIGSKARLFEGNYSEWVSITPSIFILEEKLIQY